jgi:hypothetical protein
MTPDEDGDGVGEILVGRPSNPGEALLIKGQYPILAGATERPLHLWKAPVDQILGYFIGSYLSPSGDVNGDGLPDYLLAAPERFADLDDARHGVVFLLFGGFETRVLSVQGVQPRRGVVGESTEVTVSGTGFSEGVNVFFGNLRAEGVEVLDPHSQRRITRPLRTVDVKIVAGVRGKQCFRQAFSFTSRRHFKISDLKGARFGRRRAWVPRASSLWSSVM